MLQKLEKEIDDVDAKIGDRWRLLDRFGIFLLKFVYVGTPYVEAYKRCVLHDGNSSEQNKILNVFEYLKSKSGIQLGKHNAVQ